MNPILVALDLDTADAALAMAAKVRGHVGGLKVGSHLFTSEGPRLVRALVEHGDPVFLDLKFHDIPNTVASAVGAAASLGVWMLNVHASGGLKMMQAAREAADRAHDRTGHRPLEIDAIRARCGADFLVVTPGIRTGLAAPGDDQVRTRSAREAMDAGASYLVVGRPILKAADPAAAAKEIADSL